MSNSGPLWVLGAFVLGLLLAGCGMGSGPHGEWTAADYAVLNGAAASFRHGAAEFRHAVNPPAYGGYVTCQSRGYGYSVKTVCW